MSATPETPQATARSPFAGCTIMIVCVLVMVFLVAFSTWALFRQADEIAKFTSEKRVPVAETVVQGRESDANALAERLETFRQSLDREDATRLELSADDLNLAIAAYEPLKDLRGTLRIEEIHADGKIVAAISFLMNGKPRLARDGESGVVTTDPRYLNGKLVARPELAQGEIALRIDSIDVPGATVAEPFRKQMSPYRITERYKQDPVLGPALAKLTSLEFAEGKVIAHKTPGVTPPQTITREQVDFASSRLFKAFGVVAAVFLVIVGILLAIGLRAKARRGQ
ncbi:MAG TPA: hypothetical protein VIM46_08735 [Luteolibacter sp.]